MKKLFEKGNPGRKKGAICGRKKALSALDYVAAQAGTQRKLKKMFQDAVAKSPAKFFQLYVMPLLPKETKLELEGDMNIMVQAIISETGKIEKKKNEGNNAEKESQ